MDSLRLKEIGKRNKSRTLFIPFYLVLHFISILCTTDTLFSTYLQSYLHESCYRESVFSVRYIGFGIFVFICILHGKDLFIIHFQCYFCVCSLSNMDLSSINIHLLLAVSVFINSKLHVKITFSFHISNIICFLLSFYWTKYDLLLNRFVENFCSPD